MTIRVGVFGSDGRMGSEVVRAIEAADGLSFVVGIEAGDDPRELLGAEVDVVVDFTAPAVVMENLRFAVSHGIHCVVGTSGFTPERLAQVQELADSHPEVGVLIAPNFGIAAVLMMRFAAEAAPYFDSVEIVELHHPNKADAPSGTARRTAELITEARQQAGMSAMPDATTEDPDGARGATIGDVHVHAARITGMIAHQEVVMGAPGELLTIRHDSMNRESFMPGVVLAVRKIVDRPGLTFGLEHVL